MDSSNKKNLWTYLPVVVLSAVFCCVLWGSASPAIKIAYELFRIEANDTASRLMLSGARFILAGIMVIVFGSIIERKLLVPQKSSWKLIVVLSLLQTVGQYYFFFMALAHTSGVRGSIINAAGNFFAPLLAMFVLGLESRGAKKLLGCAMGFIGIIIFFGGGQAMANTGMSFAGEGAMFCAAMFYAVSSCCIKIFSKCEDPVVLSGYQFFIGGVILFLMGYIKGGSLVFYSTGCYLNLIYMGFISAGAYTLWGILLKHNPVSRVSVLGFINPIMGVLLSALFLGEGQEAFTFRSAIALLLVSAGIFLVNYHFEKKNANV